MVLICVCLFVFVFSAGKFSCYEDYSIKMWSSWWMCCTMKRSRKYILLCIACVYFPLSPTDRVSVFTRCSQWWRYFSHVHTWSWTFLSGIKYVEKSQIVWIICKLMIDLCCGIKLVSIQHKLGPFQSNVLFLVSGLDQHHDTLWVRLD